jgi:hypothetical protein
LLAIVSTPDHHPGGRMRIWFVLQAWRSVPMSSWPIAIKIVSHLQGLRRKSLFPSGLEDVFRGEKLIFRSSLKPSFQRIKNHQFWRHVQGDMAETLSATRLKSALDRLHRRSKIGTTLLFGTHFMRTMGHWKDNFMNFNLEGCFNTCSVLEVKEKLWKMRQRQGQDGSRWWRYDEGLEPWLDDDKKKLKDNSDNKGKKWRWFSNTWQ